MDSLCPFGHEAIGQLLRGGCRRPMTHRLLPRSGPPCQRETGHTNKHTTIVPGGGRALTDWLLLRSRPPCQKETDHANKHTTIIPGGHRRPLTHRWLPTQTLGLTRHVTNKHTANMPRGGRRRPLTHRALPRSDLPCQRETGHTNKHTTIIPGGGIAGR